MTLPRRAQDVRAPDRQHARDVLGRVGVLAGEAEPALAQLAHDVLGRVEPRPLGLVDEVERVAVEGRMRGQPAQPGAERVQVGHVLALEEAAAALPGEVVGVDALVAPLVGREVEPRRSGLVPRRPHPVERERERLPARQRPHLLLAHVVRPAAAVAALAAAQQHERRNVR